MNRSKRTKLLIPDGESHLSIKVLSCLGLTKKFLIYVISDYKYADSRYCRYVSQFRYFKKCDDDKLWVDFINEQVEAFDIDVVFPIFEKSIRRLLSNKDLLSHPERLFRMPSLRSFDTAIDKWNLYEHCRDLDIPCPKTHLILNGDCPPGLKYPLVVKPTSGLGGGLDVEVIRSKSNWELYFESRSSIDQRYLVQPWIEGIDYSCSVLCDDGKIVAYTIQRSEDSFDERMGPQLGYKFIEESAILDIGTRLMESLSWSGIASMDLRYNIKDKTFNLLEVNPRFWRSVTGSAFAGINFPELLARQALGHTMAVPPVYSQITFYDLKGVVRLIRSKPSLLMNLGRLIRHSEASLAFRDPLPFIYKWVWRTRNILRYQITKGAQWIARLFK